MDRRKVQTRSRRARSPSSSSPKEQFPSKRRTSPPKEQDTILMWGLPLHVSLNHLLARCKPYGVQEITFINRGCVSSYTRSCLIKMQSQTAATEFIKKQKSFRRINRVDVKVDLFKGWENHQEVYNRGIYKLLVTGVDFKAKGDVQMYRYMEDNFHRFSYTEVTIVKRNEKPNGQVKFRFATEQARAEAMETIENEYPTYWNPVLKESKQERRVKKSRSKKGKNLFEVNSSRRRTSRQPVYPVKEWTLDVSNQKTEPHCLYFAVADMITTTLRMHLHMKDLYLSVQGLVERGKKTYRDLNAYSTNKRYYGFETTSVSPYEKLRKCCASQPWSVNEYQVPTKMRFTVDKIDWITKKDEIKPKIVEKFRDGIGGACVAEMRAGQLALRTSKDLKPYCHPEGTENEGAMHAVLIVGINVEDENEDNHYCHIKNSWGENWADGGFTNIAFKVIEAVWIPNMMV